MLFIPVEEFLNRMHVKTVDFSILLIVGGVRNKILFHRN